MATALLLTAAAAAVPGPPTPAPPPLFPTFPGAVARGALALFPPREEWVDSTVDHFNWWTEGGRTFRQRYLVWDGHWRRPGGPLLLYLGGEGLIETFYNYTGFMFEVAAAVGGLVVFPEHRYYGRSLPFGSWSFSARNISFLTLEQGMADVADMLPEVKRRAGCAAGGCPVVLFGGSYGGMMVAWFRLKYPHLTAGGVAASAPIDFYPSDARQEAFWGAVAHDLTKFGAPGCLPLVDRALARIAALAQAPAGRAELARVFRACDPLGPEPTAGEKLDFYIRGALATLGMLDYPEASNFVTSLPPNPVRYGCTHFVRAAGAGSDDKLLPALRGFVSLLVNSSGTRACLDVMGEAVGAPAVPRPAAAGGDTLGDIRTTWNYQACTELPLEPTSSDGLGFYPPADAQLDAFAANCRLRFGGGAPRAAWLPRTTGASALGAAATNLFFSDGEKDPWRTGGLRPNGSSGRGLHPSVAQELIPGAAHHEDLRFSLPGDAGPVAATKARELAHIEAWIQQWGAGA